MKKFEVKDIIIPTDFSEISYSAFYYAGEIGERYGAKLHIIHVLEDIPPVLGKESAYFSDNESDNSAEQEAYSNLEIARQYLSNITSLDVNTVLKKGTDSEEIINYAREVNAGLIVVATHGRTGVLRTLMGSVAQKIIKNSECPVLVTKSPDNT